MHLFHIKKASTAAIVALAIVAGFSAFKSSKKESTGKILAPVTLYFHGDPEIQAQVQNASLWNTTPHGNSCDEVDEAACSMVVDNSDLNAAGTSLNTTRIQLGTTNTGVAFTPRKAGGTSPNPITPINTSF